LEFPFGGDDLRLSFDLWTFFEIFEFFPDDVL